MPWLAELKTSGRLTRAGFWLRHVVPLPLLLWATIAAGRSPGPPFDLPFVLITTLFLVSVWGRRLHDRAHSAWRLLVVLVPVVGAVYLIATCGFGPSHARADRYGGRPGRRLHYRVVGS